MIEPIIIRHSPTEIEPEIFFANTAIAIWRPSDTMQAFTIIVSQYFDCQRVSFWSQILSYMNVKVTFILGSLISKHHSENIRVQHTETHISAI